MTDPIRGDDFQDPPRLPPDDAAFVLRLDAYEGPIDVLLDQARDQKVDLTQISILELADQYLAFVEHARRLRLELAADYLVMAAWLAYLKSRLLLPEEADDDEPSDDDIDLDEGVERVDPPTDEEIDELLEREPRSGWLPSFLRKALRR